MLLLAPRVLLLVLLLQTILENTYIGNDGTYEGARMAWLMDADAYAAVKVAELWLQ